MSTITAIATIGDAHPYRGGVSASYLLHLTENSSPSIQLFQMSLHEPRVELVATWTPTVENMLEDLLLLIGARVCGDPMLVAELSSRTESPALSRLYLYGIADEHRKEIYGLLQKTKFNAKVVLSVLEGCTLLNQVDRLPQYDVDCELCISLRAAVGQLSVKE